MFFISAAKKASVYDKPFPVSDGLPQRRQREWKTKWKEKVRLI